jgi:hypothetical protein
VRRDKALEGIAILDPGNLNEKGDRAISEEWDKLAASPPSIPEYEVILAKVLQDTGCDSEGAPYVIRGLLRTSFDRFASASPHPRRVAATFLNEAQCPGARGLSEDDKALLRRIRDRASPAPPSPPAAPPNQ